MRKSLGRGVFLLGVAALALAPAASGGGIAGAARGASSGAQTTATTVGGHPQLPTIEFPSTPAADAPTLTVTPSTGLVTGQSVTVTGTGFVATGPTSPSIGVAQCVAGAFGEAGCDLGNLRFPTADASGAFTLSFNVHRTILAGGGTVHCDDAPGTCILGAAVIADRTKAGSVPLEFDPNAPRPDPQVQVTPSTGLLNRDVVTVAGSGFSQNLSLTVAECALGSPYCSPELYLGEEPASAVNADGTFSVDLAVRIRQRSAVDGPTDCLSVACEIRVRSYNDPDYDVAVPITFDPTQALPPAPTVHATPTTDLADRQAVTVTGENFEPGSYVQFRECLATNDGCRYLSSSANVGADGTISIDVPVRRLVRQYTMTPPPTLVDCAVVACNLLVESYDSFYQSFPIPISFDGSLPLPPAPTVVVEPSTNLPFHAVVVATGHGFFPGAYVYAEMCLQTETSGRCGGYAEGTADPNGDIVLNVKVSRRASGYDGGTVLDCLDTGTTCVVRMQSGDEDESAQTPVSFDPNAAVPSTPVVEVDPTTNLGWIQTVAVTGSGFTPGEPVSVQECTEIGLSGSADGVVGPTFTQCVGANFNNPPTADANGNIDLPFRARKIITNGSSAPIDCSFAAGDCFVRVAGYDDFDGSPPADIPLSFDPTTLQPPGPPVTVTPSTGLSNGDTVAVAGSGFTPGATIGMAMCAGTVRSISNCDLSTSSIGNDDGSGAFARSFVMRDQIITNEGPVDCAAAPGTCVLGVANIGDYIEFSLVPLSFGPVISVGDATVDEGTGTNTWLPAMVHLSRPSARAVSVHWATTDGSAIAGQDFVGGEGDLLVPAGQTDAAIPVAVIGDATDERTERFGVTLSNAHGGPLADATARVKIHDDDRQPRVTTGDMTVTEVDSGTSVGAIPVWLSHPSSRDIVVSYRTHHGSARSGSDFLRSRGDITIPAGWTGGFIVVPIVGDHVREHTEFFTVELRGANDATIGDDTAVETIRDND